MENFEKEYWLEVELQHPKGWVLAAESGGILDGYFRVDSKTAAKLEVKWEKQASEGKARSKVQPMVVINRFIEDYMKRTGARSKIKAEVYERGNANICEHNAYFARWRGIGDVATLSWVCEDENKVFLVNYYLEPGEKWEDVAGWLIPGLVCHTSEKFWRYRLIGVEFKIPKGYALQTRRLLLGRPVAVFKAGEKTLLIHWSTFAREILAKYKSLVEWAKKEAPKEVGSVMKGLKYDMLKPDEKTGKMVVEETGRTFFGGRTTVKTLRIWHDSGSNRIFLTGYSGPRDSMTDLEELEKSIVFKPD
ncbi:MAG: hypothetical protein HA496_00275 [Thaumarchaeota archaeon]|jgi:hypothetical protein|nr:hypothetical protein [Nitrososphaerota archaeon]